MPDYRPYRITTTIDFGTPVDSIGCFQSMEQAIDLAEADACTNPDRETTRLENGLRSYNRMNATVVVRTFAPLDRTP